MNMIELRAKSIDELKSELLASLREQLNLRIQKNLGEGAKTSRFKELRRYIARIKTILNEKGSSV